MARIPKNLNKGQKRKLRALRNSLGKKIADEAFTKWFNEQKKPAAKTDKYMEDLKATVAVLVKRGLKIPPSGIKITRGRGGIGVSKIEMKRKPGKKKAKKAAAKKKPAKRKAAKKK